MSSDSVLFCVDGEGGTEEDENGKRVADPLKQRADKPRSDDKNIVESSSK